MALALALALAVFDNNVVVCLFNTQFWYLKPICLGFCTCLTH